jgi:hypothetical protein
VNAGPDQTALTGLLFSESWSFSVPDNGPWSYTIDWGDGTTTSVARPPRVRSATGTRT